MLVMVTSWSWMSNARTSSFTVRIPVWNRSGSTLRSVGLSGILLPVLCVQEWCAVYRRVRRVHLLLLRGVLGMVHFGHSGCSLGSCAHGRCWLCLFFPSCLPDSGYGGVPIAGHALWAEVGGGILCVTLGEFTGLHKSVPWMWCHMCQPLRDSLVPLVMMHVWYFWLRGILEKLQAKFIVETRLSGEEVYLSGISGLVGPDILVWMLLVLWLRSLLSVGGLLHVGRTFLTIMWWNSRICCWRPLLSRGLC